MKPIRTARALSIRAVLLASAPVINPLTVITPMGVPVTVGIAVLAEANSPARAETHAVANVLRSGDHPGFGRVVITTAGTDAYTLDQDGDHIAIHLPEDLALGEPPPLPKNILAMTINGQTVDLVLRHGTRLRPWRMNGRIVLDVMDEATVPPEERPPEPLAQARQRPTLQPLPETSGKPATVAPPPKTVNIEVPKAPSAPATEPPPAAVKTVATSPKQAVAPKQAVPPVASAQAVAPAQAVTPAQAVAPAVAPAPVQVAAPVTAEAAPPAVEAIQQIPPGRDVLPEKDGPLALRARRTRLPKEMDGTAFIVPFGTTTAAASFRGGDSTFVVFDERRPVDLAALVSDPVFGPATVRLLPTGTLLKIPHPSTQSIVLTQLPQGWRIAAMTSTPRRQPIVATASDGRLNLAADQPGEVVHMADPETGATLLVGTQHRPGQGVAPIRRSTEFILRRTSQGVIVESLSDAISLNQVASGFTLSGGAGGLALSPATGATLALTDAASLTRRLNLPSLPADTLLRLFVKQLSDAAGTPPLARGPKRHAAAESLLALGISAEAGSLLQMAAERDPKEAASPDTHALTAIAALLAGRPEEANGLLDPQLDGTDEIALWRAVRQAMLDEGSPAAAAVFAATAPLVFQYPKPIQNHILPLVIETMIQAGEIEPAARFLDQRKNDPKLDYARALLRQAEGDTGQALTMLDTLAAGRDQFDRARSAVRAAELRLATGALDKTHAADVLDKLLYSWRGDARELALRERVAELRGQTGAWRVALSTLRQAETDFPEQAAPVHQRLKDVFAAMIGDQGTQQTTPIEFVATLEENADLIPGTGDDEAIAQPLAERLLSLDLPARAKPVLEKLVKQSKSPVAKARFGATLATLDSREGDDGGAISVLDTSQSPDLPPELTEQRLIIRAGAVARRGDPAAGAALLAAAHTPPTMEARAQILEAASDWPAAARAWADWTALTLPERDALDEAQTRGVLRLATATARSGDDAGLVGLREKFAARIGAGPLADMFRLLTAEPIRTSADIGRSLKEMNLATSVSAGLKAVPGAEATR